MVNSEVEVKAEADGRILLTMRRRRGQGILAFLQPPVLERNVRLDEVGSFVFGLIDGKRRTRDIIEVFVERYRTNRREAELSVVAFLKSLTQKGAISILVTKVGD